VVFKANSALTQLSLPEGARTRKALVMQSRTKKVCTKISYCSIQPHFADGQRPEVAGLS